MNDHRKDATSRALVWSYIGTVARLITQFVIGVVFARLLNPHDFGVAAAGWMIVNLVSLIADGGAAAYLIQKDKVTAEDLGEAFSWQMLIGLTLAAIFLTFSGLYADAMGVSGAVDCLRVISIVFFVQSVGVVPTALLKRTMDFKALHIITVATYLIANVMVGLPLAMYGSGAWALVWAQVAQSLLYSVLVYFKSDKIMPIRPAAPRWVSGSFGLKVVADNSITWVLMNVDALIIGKVIGPVALGIYNRSSALIQPFGTAIVGGLQGVLYSSAAATHRETKNVGVNMLYALSLVSLLCSPIVIFLASAASDLVQLVYGSKWSGVRELLPPMAFSMMAAALSSTLGPVLLAKNMIAVQIRLNYIALPFLIALVYLASQESVMTVAWVIAITSAVRFFLALKYTSRALSQSPFDALWYVFWGLGSTVPAGLVLYILQLGFYSLPLWVRVALDVCVFSLVQIGVWRISGGWLLDKLSSSGLPVKSLPGVIRKIFGIDLREGAGHA